MMFRKKNKDLEQYQELNEYKVTVSQVKDWANKNGWLLITDEPEIDKYRGMIQYVTPTGYVRTFNFEDGNLDTVE